MNCKLCGENEKLIKAHIIPEGFFRPLRSGKMVPEIHSNIKGVFPKRSPIGIYDNTILCEKCDKYLGVWDGYAQKLLIQYFSEELAVQKGKTKAASYQAMLPKSPIEATSKLLDILPDLHTDKSAPILIEPDFHLTNVQEDIIVTSRRLPFRKKQTWSVSVNLMITDHENEVHPTK